MNLSVPEQQFLVAAFIISGGETDRRMEARALTDRVDFGDQPSGWIIRAVRNLGALGFLAPYVRDGYDDDQFVHLTAAGNREAERLRDSGVGLTWLSNDLTDKRREEQAQTESRAEPHDPPTIIDSQSWTGRTGTTRLTGDTLKQFLSMLSEAERAVTDTPMSNNAERQQVLALVGAIRLLSEAPDPPEREIAALLNILGSIASVGSLFVGLVQMMIQITGS